MMRNFKKLFEEFESKNSASHNGGLQLLSTSTPLRIYYGFTRQAKPRLAFLMSCPQVEISSTKAIKVSFLPEGDSIWLNFDLVEQSASAVYYSFCDDLVSALESSAATRQEDALMNVKNRFVSWRKMFLQERSGLSEEAVVGLLGELYFLDKFLIPELGVIQAIKAWSGIDGLSKDFSYDEKWYEVKAVSLNSNVVKINSLTQLSSDAAGVLAVVRYETMSRSYEDDTCTVFRIFKRIMSTIDDDDARADFLSKLIAYGFDVIQETEGNRYRVSEMAFYKIDGEFPRIKESDIKYREVDKVTYCLILNALDNFKFDGRL